MSEQRSRARQIIDLITYFISTGNEDQFRRHVAALNLAELGPEPYFKLLVRYLNVARQYGQDNMTRLIIETWSEANYSEDDFSLVAKLFAQDISDELLNYVLNLHLQYTAMDILDDWIANEYTQFFTIVADRIIRLMGVTRTSLNTLLTLSSAELHNNMYARGYLMEAVADRADFAPIPAWIHNFLPGDVPFENELALPEPPTIAAVATGDSIEIMIQALLARGMVVDAEAAREVAQKVMNEETEQTLQLFAAHKAAATDVGLFRLLGPANARSGDDFTQNHVCTAYGGCRMFLCVDYEILDAETDDYDEAADWYLGWCEVCLRRLRNRAHAVRMPIVGGGWMGCYCSWQCVRQTEPAPDLFTSDLIRIVEQQMNQIGIQDRR